MLDVHKFVHRDMIIPLNAELNPACHLLASWGDHHILHVSRIRVMKVTNMMQLYRLIYYS
jgi:hypothetical protein